jgi:hypothetical protein
MTQTERLVKWLRANPGSSSLEITKALSLVNVTGRVSDARKDGHRIDCVRISGTARYFLREPEPEQLRWVTPPVRWSA